VAVAVAAKEVTAKDAVLAEEEKEEEEKEEPVVGRAANAAAEDADQAFDKKREPGAAPY
jgi:hypothetical protein